MTHKEVIELEKHVDKLFTETLKKDSTVLLALSGDLRVSFRGYDEEKYFVNLSKKDLQTVAWVHYTGDYNVLMDVIALIKKTVRQNMDVIRLLVDSYSMDLEEDENGGLDYESI